MVMSGSGIRWSNAGQMHAVTAHFESENLVLFGGRIVETPATGLLCVPKTQQQLTFQISSYCLFWLARQNGGKPTAFVVSVNVLLKSIPLHSRHASM